MSSDLHIAIIFSFLFYFYIFNFLKCLFILRERERVSASGGGRGAESTNPKQVPNCQHRALHGARTHEPWDHDLSRNQDSDASPTEPPRRPYFFFFLLHWLGLSLWCWTEKSGTPFSCFSLNRTNFEVSLLQYIAIYYKN